MGRITLMLLVAAMLAAPAGALEVELEVAELAGVGRNANHVDCGFPLPAGAITSVSQLGLFRRDANTGADEPAPASFVVREKYLSDGSVRWATVHFLAYVSAGEKALYVVKDAQGAEMPYPVKVNATRDQAVVDTGAIQFTVARDPFAVIHTAWFDPGGDGKYKDRIVEPGAARLKANVTRGSYRIVGKQAVFDAAEAPADVVARADKIELEEHSPGRAVVKVTGQFLDGIRPALDFVVRIYAVARSPSVRVSFTVINRSGKRWQEFIGINELALELPVRLGGADMSYTFSSSSGDDVSGQLQPGGAAWLLQPNSENYVLGGLAGGGGRCKSIATRRMGWVDLVGPKFGLAAGIRNFWQTHPKGLAVSGDGTVCVQLVPRQDKPFETPASVCSQALQRIDLFTGGARTHEFLLAFHAANQPGGQRVMSIVDPLFGAAKPGWYCQRTQAEGPLWSADPENFAPEHRQAVEAFDRNARRQFDALVGPGRRNGQSQGLEEFGWLNFGCGVESAGGQFVAPNDALNSHWDGNSFDFPRAALVHFWRTGDFAAWQAAQAAAMHVADVGIAHANPDNPRLVGMDRSGPNVGHFRLWVPGTPFGASNTLENARNQGLFDLYHMTGDAWFLDAAGLVSEYCLSQTASGLRAAAGRSNCLFQAFEQTGEAKFLEENASWLGRIVPLRAAEAKWDRSWTYGLAAECLMDMYRRTGDRKWAQGVVDCCDSLIANYWQGDAGAPPLQGMSVNCFGYAYELTGDREYLDKGLVMLNQAARQAADRTRTFAQQFRLSPYFLNYLAKNYELPDPVVEKPGVTPQRKDRATRPDEPSPPPADDGLVPPPAD